MPTAATDTFVIDRVDPFIMRAGQVLTEHVKFVATQTLAKGTILGEVTASGEFKAYANANVDGSDVARGILQYAIVVDASNNVTIADGSGQVTKTAPMILPGQGHIWLGEDLVGLDAPGLVDLGGSIVKQPLATGQVAI